MELGFYFLLAYFALWIVIAAFGVMIETRDYLKYRRQRGF